MHTKRQHYYLTWFKDKFDFSQNFIPPTYALSCSWFSALCIFWHLDLNSICVKGEQKQWQNKNYYKKPEINWRRLSCRPLRPVNAPLKLWWWQLGNRILSAKQTEIRTPQIKTTGSYQLNNQTSERGEYSDKFFLRYDFRNARLVGNEW